MEDNNAAANPMETSMSYSDDDETIQLPAHCTKHISQPNEPPASIPFTILQNGKVITPMDKDETSSKETNNPPSVFSASIGSFNRNLGFYQSENQPTPITTTTTTKSTASAFENDSHSTKNEKHQLMKNETPEKIPSSNNTDNTNSSNQLKVDKKSEIFPFILLLMLGGGIYFFVVEMNWKPLNNQLNELQQEMKSQSDVIQKLASRSEKYKMESLEQKSLSVSLEIELKLATDELAVVKMELLKQGNLIEQTIKEMKFPTGSILSTITNNQDPNKERPPNPGYTSNEKYSVSANHFRQSVRSLMKSSFLSQPRDTWVQIMAAALSTMSEEKPMRPAALLVVSPSWIEPDFGICFARKLGESINEAFHAMNKFGDESNNRVKEIDSNYFTEMSSLTDVHIDLKNYLDFEGKSVIVKNLNDIQKEDELLVFHAFCDDSNDMAYDTRANFIFTLTVPFHSVQNEYDWRTHGNGAQIARRALNQAWANVISADKRAALISRVAANVILLQDGDSCS